MQTISKRKIMLLSLEFCINNKLSVYVYIQSMCWSLGLEKYFCDNNEKLSDGKSLLSSAVVAADCVGSP